MGQTFAVCKRWISNQNLTMNNSQAGTSNLKLKRMMQKPKQEYKHTKLLARIHTIPCRLNLQYLETGLRFTSYVVILYSQQTLKLYKLFVHLHVQQTPKPLAQEPADVPPLFVHSDLHFKINVRMMGKFFNTTFVLIYFDRQ